MKPSAELFELIKALTSNEKRYFKLYASLQKGSKNYLNLFKAIDSMKVYDEKLMKILYSREKFSMNLAYTKNYLHKLIFKSLISYNEGKYADMKLAGLLSQCRILFDKSLYRQYFRMLKTGKMLAVKQERYSYLLEFLELERQLTKKEELSKNDIDKIFKEKNEVLDKLKLINSNKRAVNLLFKYQRLNGKARSRSSFEETEKITETLTAEKGKESVPVTAQESYYMAMSLLHSIRGEEEKSFNFAVKRNNVITENPDIFGSMLFDNKNDSNVMMILSASEAGMHKKALRMLREFGELLKSKEADINYKFAFAETGLNYCTDTGDKKYFEKYLSGTEALLDGYRNKITVNTHNYLYFRLAGYFFAAGNNPEALRIINLLYKSGYMKYSPFIEPYTKMLNVLIHYELGNYKLLKYLIHSAVKFLKSRNSYYSTESSVLKIVRELSGIKKEEHRKKKYLTSLEIFSDLKNTEYEKNAFFYIDYVKWIKGKLSAVLIKN